MTSGWVPLSRASTFQRACHASSRICGTPLDGTEHFTSRSVVVSERRPGPDDLPAPIGISPPITSDPPFHKLARRMLPAFGRRSVAALEPFTRQLCRALLDQTTGTVVLDAAAEYAQHIPVRVIVRFGFPQSDAGLFRRFIHQVMEEVDTTAREREAIGVELDDYIDAQIDDHIANPRGTTSPRFCPARRSAGPGCPASTSGER